MDRWLAKELRLDKSKESRDLLVKELHPEMALWTQFIIHNLIPSKLETQTIISQELTQILFSIKRGPPIDVGHIIHKQMCDAFNSTSSLLPFPCLITHFCRISRVATHGNLCAPLLDTGSVPLPYNHQGLPVLPLGKQVRSIHR